MEPKRGQVAVITGAASGIGAALANRFARHGLDLVLCDVADATPVAEAAQALGAAALVRQCDVSDASSVAALALAAYDRFGKVNIVCANAGVVAFSPVLETPLEQWERAMRVNFFGVLNTCQAFVPRMIAGREDAHVLITASGAGLTASSVLPTGAYSASKFAAVGFGEQLRLDLAASGIGVTILCPGSVKTGILETATYAPSQAHLRPTNTGGPTPGREHVRRMEPADVADLAITGIRENAAYVITHPEMQPALEARFGAQVAACVRTREVLGLTV